MISFKQFLEESRQAYLYHATANISDILHSDQLLPKTGHFSFKLLKEPIQGKSSTLYPRRSSGYDIVTGISTTRSLRFAKGWDRFIIVLDLQKIRQNYKLVPIDYWRGLQNPTTSEGEEFIITKKPLPLKKYVVKILTQEKYSAVNTHIENSGYPVEYY